MKFEEEVVWQVGFIAPGYPADTGVYEAKSVAGCVDSLDAGELKVPFWSTGFGMGKGGYESTRRCIYVYWDVDASLFLVGV